MLQYFFVDPFGHELLHHTKICLFNNNGWLQFQDDIFISNLYSFLHDYCSVESNMYAMQMIYSPWQRTGIFLVVYIRTTS
jgi:hypothetical protein